MLGEWVDSNDETWTSMTTRQSVRKSRKAGLREAFGARDMFTQDSSQHVEKHTQAKHPYAPARYVSVDDQAHAREDGTLTSLHVTVKNGMNNGLANINRQDASRPRLSPPVPQLSVVCTRFSTVWER
jgi:hypothetical protein